MRYCYAAISLLLLLACLPSHAQSPNPAANGPVGQDNAGFYRGWTFGTSFEGSTSGDGSVYDLGTAVGYNFSHHFGVDLGVPYNFVGTPSAVKTKNPGAVSGYGIGNVGADLKWLFPGKTTNYASTIHLGAPTPLGIGQIISNTVGETSRRTSTPASATPFRIASTLRSRL